MEFVILSIGILVALVVTAAVMDIRARRTRRRIRVESDGVLNARRSNSSRDQLYTSGGG